MALLCSHFALALPAPIRAGADVQPHPATVTPHDDLLSQTTLSQTAQKVTPPGNVLSDITNGKSGAQDSFPHDALKNGASDKGPDSKDSAKDKGSSLFDKEHDAAHDGRRGSGKGDKKKPTDKLFEVGKHSWKRPSHGDDRDSDELHRLKEDEELLLEDDQERLKDDEKRVKDERKRIKDEKKILKDQKKDHKRGRKSTHRRPGHGDHRDEDKENHRDGDKEHRHRNGDRDREDITLADGDKSTQKHPKKDGRDHPKDDKTTERKSSQDDQHLETLVNSDSATLIDDSTKHSDGAAQPSQGKTSSRHGKRAYYYQ